MKNIKSEKILSNKSSKARFLNSIRIYFMVLRGMHRGKGIARIIAAYFFFVFALVSFTFTIKVPLTRDFITPGSWELIQSRMITGFMIIMNLAVYSMIMNWRKTNIIQNIIRAVVIGLVVYLDVMLIQIIYILIVDRI